MTARNLAALDALAAQIYLAGMRAGIERAAKAIETASSSPSFGLRARWIAAIRALLD